MPLPVTYPPVQSVDFIVGLKAIDISTFTSVEEYIIIYVKYHSHPFDFGGGFFYFNPLSTDDDDNGIVVEPNITLADGKGRWLRKFDGHINVRYYGALGNRHPDDGLKIQTAIDYAAKTHDFSRGSNTVYIPGGNYIVNNQLKLKSGVSIIGDSVAETFLIAGYENFNDDYMMVMEEGRIQGCNIANINFDGEQYTSNDWDPSPGTITKGCMLFVATRSGLDDDGGMWNCTFKNIRIWRFNGSGIVMYGGGCDEKNEGCNDYRRPNQLNVFENVYVIRQKETTFALYMWGNHGQTTFINCGFDGIKYRESGTGPEDTFYVLKGFNVMLLGRGNITLIPAVISFINCSFQSGEYGIYMEYCESVTVDTCWFEMLDMAVTVKTNNNKLPSRGVNILNSRFTNAGSFGSLRVDNKVYKDENIHGVYEIVGRCITSYSSEINVYNNYVCVSKIPDDVEPNPQATYANRFNPLGKRFILALENNLGVRTSGNCFQDYRLGYSFGITQIFQVEEDPSDIHKGYLNLRDTKIAIVQKREEHNHPIERISCSINSGETLSIRSSGGLIFNDNKNIFLSGNPSLTLADGEIATFVKIDIENAIYGELYHLISVY